MVGHGSSETVSENDEFGRLMAASEGVVGSEHLVSHLGECFKESSRKIESYCKHLLMDLALVVAVLIVSGYEVYVLDPVLDEPRESASETDED
jgi:hypothetical protein